MMKTNPEHPDDLDRLLSRLKTPETPPWFEARVMARIARERDEPQSVWRTWFSWFSRPVLVWTGAAAVVMVVALSWMPGWQARPDAAGERQLTAALEAFESYKGEQALWLADSSW
jgi:hypothetical protein